MISLSDWDIDRSDSEAPCVRVGIVLPQDRMTRLRLDVPDAAYRLSDGAGATQDIRNDALECHVQGTAVRVVVAGRDVGISPEWTLIPVSGQAGVAVDGVVAGRGFHWQGTTRQVLPGTLTVRNRDGCLLLIACPPLEEYLAGVITSEMSGDCPPEFLKAQCVVARSWTLAHTERKHDDWGIDLCNDDCCQRYQGIAGLTDAARLAVDQTRGEVLVADVPDTGGRRVVDANYSKSCGGVTEDPENVWGVAKPGICAVLDAPSSSALARLMPVTDANVEEFVARDSAVIGQAYCSPAHAAEADLPRYLGRVDRGGGLFRWTVSQERSDLENILRGKGYAPPDMAELLDVLVTRRGVSGRALAVDLVCRTTGGEQRATSIRGEYEIRRALHKQFLYSSAFRIRTERDASTAGGRVNRFNFDGAGWGHGVGLCQIGALGMALAGHSYREILAHYFPRATTVCCAAGR